MHVHYRVGNYISIFLTLEQGHGLILVVAGVTIIDAEEVVEEVLYVRVCTG